MSLPSPTCPMLEVPARFWLPQFCNVAPLDPIGPSFIAGMPILAWERHREKRAKKWAFLSFAATPEGSP
jgi:hypothetical protein